MHYFACEGMLLQVKYNFDTLGLVNIESLFWAQEPNALSKWNFG